MKVIALYSIKGGVGKTASCVNLAYSAAKSGANVLICDLDPQGSASYYFRIRPAKKLSPEKLIKGSNKLTRLVKGTDFEGLDLLPSNLSLRNLDLALDEVKHRRRRLRGTLQTFASDYDFVFLDCPPNITLVSENIFRASDCILVPVIPTTLSFLTLEKLDKFFKKEHLNRKQLYPFFSMVEARKKLHKNMMQQISVEYKRVLTTPIRYMADIEKMGIYRKPVAEFAPGSPAVSAYEALWLEVLAIL
ncbi:MAG: ParA family protein [Calditrichaeota bacterium]|nr:MAG: ParA family protein [Calditrichota bacterium]